jgi:hypothetical protein
MEFLIDAVDGSLIDYSFFVDDNQLVDVQKRRNVLLYNALFLKRSSFHSAKSAQVPRAVPKPNALHAVQLDRSMEKLKEYRLQFSNLESLVRMRVRQGFVIEKIQFTEEPVIMDYRGDFQNFNFRAEFKSVTMKFMLRPNVEIEYAIRISKNVTSGDGIDTNDDDYEKQRASTPHELSSYKLRRGSYDYQYVQHSRHHSDLGNFNYPQLDNQSQITVRIFSHGPAIFQDKFRMYKKKHPGNAPSPLPTSTSLGNLNSVHTTALEFSIYSSLMSFVHGIIADDKLTDQLHNAEKCGLSTNLQLRSSALSPLVQLRERQSYSPLFDEINIIVQLPSDAPPYIKYESAGENLVQHLLQSPTVGAPPPITANDIRYQHAHGMLRHLLDKNWSSARIGEDFYIKFPPQHNNDVTVMMMMTEETAPVETPSSEEEKSPGGFSLLRVYWHTHAIVELKMLFFNVVAGIRSEMIGNFKQLIRQIKNITPLHKPVLCSVLSKIPRVTDEEITFPKQVATPPHYTDYMFHNRWVWPVAATETSTITNSIMSVMFAQRLREGFSLISFGNTTVFLKTITIEKSESTGDIPSPRSISSSAETTKLFLFYCVHMPHKCKQIITEMWLEPQTGRITFDDFYIISDDIRDEVQDWIMTIDTEIVSLFKTFDIIQNACKNNQSTSLPVVLKTEETHDIQDPDLANVPFNIVGVYERSYKQPVTFNIYTIRGEVEETQKLTVLNANKKMFDRLVRIIALMNDIEIPLDQVPFEFFKDLGTVELGGKYRCFARNVVIHGESTTNRSMMRKRFVLTIVSSITPSNGSVDILVCECNENDLAALSSLSRSAVDDPVTQYLFGDHNALARSSSRGSSTALSSTSSSEFPSDIPTTSTPRMSPDSYHYFDFLLNMHSYSYAYGVYKSLQTKEYVSKQSIVMAVESCFEYRDDIDLTEFFEAILLSRDYFFKTVDKRGKSPYEEMNEYFRYVINKYFDSVPGSEYHYYFNDFQNDKQQLAQPSNQSRSRSNPGVVVVNALPNVVMPGRKLSGSFSNRSA